LLIKNIIKEPFINNLQSKIIKDYNDKLMGSEEYFEDKVMSSFNDYFNRCENADAYDDICNNIIYIYYYSIQELNNYYSNIYKKKKIATLFSIRGTEYNVELKQSEWKRAVNPKVASCVGKVVEVDGVKYRLIAA
jgi:hypothetical protein